MNMNIDNIDVEEAVNISTYTNDIYLETCSFITQKTEAIPATLALSMLQAGNKRFVENRSILLNNSQLRVKQSQEDQDPFAVVFGCSDSRPAPTIIFNRGSSDIFEARTAGEIIYNNFDITQNSAQVVESIQFGVNILKVRLLLIMGHTNCGAVIYTQNYFNANTTTPQQPAPSTEPYNVVYNSLYNAYSKYPGGAEAPNEYTVPIINAQAEDVAKYLYDNSQIIRDEVANKNNNRFGNLQIWTAIYNDDTGVVDTYKKIY